MTKLCSGQARNAIKLRSKGKKSYLEELRFFCTKLRNIATIIHSVPTRDDKVVFQRSTKCCKNEDQKEITQRHYEVEL